MYSNRERVSGRFHRKWVNGHLPLRREIDKMQKSIATAITSLTAVDKMFGQLLNHQVIYHCNKTLYSKMTEYSKKQSCETSLLGLIEDCKLAIDTLQVIGMTLATSVHGFP